MNAWMPVLPRFEGKKKDRFTAESEALTRRLLKKGYDRDYFKREWDAVLWTVRSKDDHVRVKVDAGKKFDAEKFQRFLQNALEVSRVRVMRLPVESCCHSPCKGCMNGNKSQRKIWIG